MNDDCDWNGLETPDELGFFPTEDCSDFVAELEDVDEEVAPGIVVERRAVLHVPLMLSATLAGGLLAPLAAQDRARAQGQAKNDKTKNENQGKGSKRSPFAPLSFDQLIDELQPLAEGMREAKNANEEAYLNSIASMLQRLRRDTIPQRVRKRPIALFQLRLAPGRTLPWHDHRDYNGVILGLESEIRIRNYEVVEPKSGKHPTLGATPIPPKGEDFLIRETVDAMITPGRVSTLARRRDNIHDLRAGAEGGRVLDVFTFFEKSAGSQYMQVDDKPVDAKKRVYRARWPERRRRTPETKRKKV